MPIECHQCPSAPNGDHMARKKRPRRQCGEALMSRLLTGLLGGTAGALVVVQNLIGPGLDGLIGTSVHFLYRCIGVIYHASTRISGFRHCGSMASAAVPVVKGLTTSTDPAFMSCVDVFPLRHPLLPVHGLAAVDGGPAVLMGGLRRRGLGGVGLRGGLRRRGLRGRIRRRGPGFPM